MQDMKQNIDEIKNLLTDTINILNTLNDDNFNSHLNKGKLKMDSARELKNELLKAYTKEDLMPFEGEINDLAKQIETSFDNIIKQKYQEKCLVAEEIGRLLNNKKLQNYRR